MIQKQVLMAGPTLHPTIESTLCVSCTPPFDLDKCWCPGEVSAVSPLGRFPCKCRRKCTGENRGQVVWRKEVGKSKEADSCSMRAGLWTHRHRLCPMHLCASLGWSQAKAECSSHVLGEEIMQIIFSQGVVKEMDSGRNTEGKSAKWEHSFHWRARISPWGGVAFEKGFEGRKGCEN